MMQTVISDSESSTEVKGSKFLAYLVPYDQFSQTRNKLQDENPKATHIIYALRYLNEHDQIVENSNDDGEPKGSAGGPALNVIRGEKLVNVALLIVRYFGGTKLGIGGMIRAYTTASKNVIEESDIIKYEKILTLIFSSTYSSIQHIEYLLKKQSIQKINKEFLHDSVSWTIESTQEQLDEFKNTAGREIKCSV